MTETLSAAVEQAGAPHALQRGLRISSHDLRRGPESPGKSTSVIPISFELDKVQQRQAAAEVDGQQFIASFVFWTLLHQGRLTSETLNRWRSRTGNDKADVLTQMWLRLGHTPAWCHRAVTLTTADVRSAT